jgi:hypothetical protein
MFRTPNVLAAVAGMRLNRREVKDADPITLAETNLVIEPWPAALLNELGPEAFAHVFLSSHGVRPELRDVTLRPIGGALQRFTMKIAIGAGTADVLEPAVVEWIKFTRREKAKEDRVWIRGVIRCTFEYRDKGVREFFAKRFGQSIFLTTESLEGRLDFEAPAAIRDKPAATPTDPNAPGPSGASRSRRPQGDVLDEKPAKDGRTH